MLIKFWLCGTCSGSQFQKINAKTIFLVCIFCFCFVANLTFASLIRGIKSDYKFYIRICYDENQAMDLKFILSGKQIILLLLRPRAQSTNSKYLVLFIQQLHLDCNKYISKCLSRLYNRHFPINSGVYIVQLTYFFLQIFTEVYQVVFSLKQTHHFFFFITSTVVC